MEMLEIDYDLILRVKGTARVYEGDYQRGLGDKNYLDRIILWQAEEKIDDRDCEIEVEWS